MAFAVKMAERKVEDCGRNNAIIPFANVRVTNTFEAPCAHPWLQGGSHKMKMASSHKMLYFCVVVDYPNDPHRLLILLAFEESSAHATNQIRTRQSSNNMCSCSNHSK